MLKNVRNRFSNQITGSVLTAVVLMAAASTLLANIPGANVPGNLGNSAVSPPSARFNGNTYAEWTQKWWLWDFSLPADQDPTSNAAAPCTNGQSGHVWFLYGGPSTVNCTVPPGTALFLPVANTECSNL